MMSPTRKAKIIWHCRRGMLELDLILERFLTQYLEQLTETELVLFEEFLTHQDPDLHAWLMGHMAAEPEYQNLVHLIQQHSKP